MLVWGGKEGDKMNPMFQRRHYEVIAGAISEVCKHTGRNEVTILMKISFSKQRAWKTKVKFIAPTGKETNWMDISQAELYEMIKILTRREA